MKTLVKISITLFFFSVAACSSNPTLSEQMASHGKQLVEEGNKQWEEGSKMVEEGKDKVQRGNRLLEDAKHVEHDHKK
ncbi:MAG: hypothetical protein CTY18_00905 [Methylomonas sp.]|nr:MAG: hypothetical protein CTY18_00905 [Methylomonas sp.]